MADNVRLQFEVTSARLRELDVIMDKCDLSTRKELFSNALTLLEWAVRESARGNIIASIDEGEKKIRELRMPILDAAAQDRHPV